MVQNPKLLAGVDFTSAPGPRKPITAASGHWHNGILTVTDIIPMINWPAFEQFLSQAGENTLPCDLMALDFPFSLPWSFLQATDWPCAWADVMARLCRMSKADFEHWIQAYCDSQPAGRKFHFRPTDRLTRSSSPMKLFYPPVGKMLFQGATRLFKAGHLSVLPFRPRPNTTRCVEGYPALVARHLLTQSDHSPKRYKSDTQTTDSTEPRQKLLQQAMRPGQLSAYGIHTLIMPETIINTCVADPGGDYLDAVFCLIQAAWAVQQPDNGIPANHSETAEGWIVDPSQYNSILRA